jgi:hypothetical protein
MVQAAVLKFTPTSPQHSRLWVQEGRICGREILQVLEAIRCIDRSQSSADAQWPEDDGVFGKAGSYILIQQEFIQTIPQTRSNGSKHHALRELQHLYVAIKLGHLRSVVRQSLTVCTCAKKSERIKFRRQALDERLKSYSRFGPCCSSLNVLCFVLPTN